MAPEAFSQDFDDFIAELQSAGVEYVIVGAHALAAHGYVRATGDSDVRNKRATGRTKDAADAEMLEALRNAKR